MSDTQDDLLTQLIVTSGAARLVRGITSAVSRSRESSVLTARARALSGRIRSMPPAEHVRHAATVISVAALVHLALLMVSPAHTVSALPPRLWMTVATGAAIVAAAAGPLSRAWLDSWTATIVKANHGSAEARKGGIRTGHRGTETRRIS